MVLGNYKICTSAVIGSGWLSSSSACVGTCLIRNLLHFGICFDLSAFVNSSRAVIKNLHPICICSCLFTSLTEGRSARDLTQAAPSQKKCVCLSGSMDLGFRSHVYVLFGRVLSAFVARGH